MGYGRMKGLCEGDISSRLRSMSRSSKGGSTPVGHTKMSSQGEHFLKCRGFWIHLIWVDSKFLKNEMNGDLPVIVSCASLAIADAGIMMYDLVSAVSLSCIGKQLVIDPTSEEEACQDGNLMITYMSSRNEVTQFTLTGEWSTAKINEAMELCLDACSKLTDIQRFCLRENVLQLTA